MPNDPSVPDSALDASERIRLVQEHFAYVWRLLRRMGLSPADADDAAQETFLVGLRKKNQIEAGRERAFLYRCALNKVAQFRASRARKHEELQPDVVDPRAVSAEDLLHRKQAQHELDLVLSRLSDEQRAVFVLYEIEELTLGEIAELLGIPSGTVASRLRLARARVQAEVVPEYLGPTNVMPEPVASQGDKSILSPAAERS